MAHTVARALLGIATAATVGIGVEPREAVDPAVRVVTVSPAPAVVEAARAAPAVAVPDPTVPVTPPSVTAPAPRTDTAAAADVAVPSATIAAPPPPPPPPPAGSQERSEAALAQAVPAAWRDRLPVTTHIIEGSTSYASRSMTINVSRYHADGRWSHLVSVIGHEFGHIIAYFYGTRAFNGAAPEGWPDPHHGPPAEAWADCVSEVFTEIVDPSYGMPPCPQPTREWTANWLAAGPP